MLLATSVALSVAIGLAVGVGGFTFAYAKGASYMKDDPSACANCHVMQEQLDAWRKSSHHAVAVCNDCHTPEGFVPKYFTKALNGYHHSVAFTSGDFHEPIQIKARNFKVTESRCRSCHQAITSAITHPSPAGDEQSCTSCHRSVGHLH